MNVQNKSLKSYEYGVETSVSISTKSLHLDDHHTILGSFSAATNQYFLKLSLILDKSLVRIVSQSVIRSATRNAIMKLNERTK